MQMPFGKFKGLDVDDLEENYLLWLWANVNLYEPLRSEVHRLLYGEGADVVVLEPDRIKTVYRELSRKYHPDHGGDHLAQCAVNEFYSKLIEV